MVPIEGLCAFIMAVLFQRNWKSYYKISKIEGNMTMKLLFSIVLVKGLIFRCKIYFQEKSQTCHKKQEAILPILLAEQSMK